MKIAVKPKIIISSFIKGTGITISAGVAAGFLFSNHLKKANAKNAMLQINANFEKTKTTLMPCLIYFFTDACKSKFYKQAVNKYLVTSKINEAQTLNKIILICA